MEKKTEIFNEILKNSDIKDIIRELLDEQSNYIINNIHNTIIQSQYKEELFKENLKLKKEINHLNSEIKYLKETLEKKVVINNKLNNEFNQALNKNKIIEEENKNLQLKISELNITSNEKDKIYAELRYKYENENERFIPYNKIDLVYNYFLKLDYDIKQRLSNIFVSDNLYCFIASGIQWQNIEGLWNFIKRKILENENNCLEELRFIFLVLFEIYNNQKKNHFIN